jgi:hypothetical protein
LPLVYESATPNNGRRPTRNGVAVITKLAGGRVMRGVGSFALWGVTMSAKKGLLESAALLTLSVVIATSTWAQTYQQTPDAPASSHAPAVRNIDEVELMSVESRMGAIERVTATKLVRGREARNILSVWRRQRFGGRSAAMCHEPPYALKFYSKGRVVLFATICWACHNVMFDVPETKDAVAFAADSRSGKMLREIFEKAFPSERKIL